MHEDKESETTHISDHFYGLQINYFSLHKFPYCCLLLYRPLTYILPVRHNRFPIILNEMIF